MIEQEVRKAIGKNIQRIRKFKGLSQKDLAQKINVGVPNVSYIETGKYAPRLNTLIKIAEVLNAELYEFFVFEPNVKKETLEENLIQIIKKDEKTLRYIYRIYLALGYLEGPKHSS